VLSLQDVFEYTSTTALVCTNSANNGLIDTT